MARPTGRTTRTRDGRPSPRRLAPAVVLGLLLATVGCGSGSGHRADGTGAAPSAGSSSSVGGSGASAPVTASRGAGAAAGGPAAVAGAVTDWPTYHGDDARTGATSAGPDGRRSPSVGWTAHVDGAIYGVPVAAQGLVVVATERDVVAALDQRTGAVRWSRTIGAPVDGGDLPCGDISPSGVTSTPVIDPVAGVVHVVAFVAPARHELVTLALADGAERSRVTVDPPGLDPRVEQQRGALTLANGRVYVAFGGLYGDCGPYKGAVVARPTAALDGSGATDAAGRAPGLEAWETAAAREAGVWAAPGPTVGPDGSLWIATGNAGHEDGAAFDGGDAVIHLGADLRQRDVFAPSSWRSLAAADADLGSSAPTLTPAGVVQAGKTGDAYLLDPSHLGGVGGERVSAHACDGVYGGTATADGVVYLPCRDGVTALRVGGPPEAPRLSVLWRSASLDAGGPILAGGAVWVPDLGSGELVALDPGTGRARSRTRVGNLAHFATIGLGGGRLLVGTMDGTVTALGG